MFAEDGQVRVTGDSEESSESSESGESGETGESGDTELGDGFEGIS
jgi:hypothetical protein